MGTLLGKPKDTQILVLGLDKSGKTRGEQVENPAPTVGFNIEAIKRKNIKLNVWDVGGQESIRSLWKHYFSGSHGLIFVVDSTDTERIQEASSELLRVANDPELTDVPILVLANKQDIPEALSVEALEEKLKLKDLKKSKCDILSISSKDGTGVFESIDLMLRKVKTSDKK